MNFKTLDESDYDFLANFVNKVYKTYCPILDYANGFLWMADLWRGKYTRIWDQEAKDKKQLSGIIAVQKIVWESKAYKPNKKEEVRVKVSYYSIPIDKEIELQWLQIVEKDLGCKIEGTRINGKETSSTDSDNPTSTSTSKTCATRSGNGKYAKRNSEGTSNTNGKRQATANQLHPVPA